MLDTIFAVVVCNLCIPNVISNVRTHRSVW